MLCTPLNFHLHSKTSANQTPNWKIRGPTKPGNQIINLTPTMLHFDQVAISIDNYFIFEIWAFKKNWTLILL